MAYGMQQLRKAGRAIQDFDAAYAARASRDMGGEELAPTRTTLGGQPLFGQQSYTTRAERNADSQQVRGKNASMLEHLVGDIGERAIVAGMIGTNAGYRYGLPAAGLTLAGKGLYDLTAAFGGTADQPGANELDPGSAAVGATAGGLSTAGLAAGAYMMGQMDGEEEAKRLSLRY